MTMKYTRLKDMSVTSLSPCEGNDDLFLASYGKFYFNTKTEGVVCLWNVLNPGFPERYFEFKSPVTYAEFSKQHPCIVGIAHLGGHISVIDISSKRLKLLSSDLGSTIHRFRPVWQFRWFKNEDDNDVPFTCGGNGKVLIYMKETDFASRTLFKAERREGKLKGIELKNNYKPGVMPVAKRPGILCLAQHPTHRSLFLIGTEDGCIHKCSIHQNDHLDVWAAHLGPVQGIEFHPTCEHVLLSYGGDTFRVWVIGLDDPVLSYRPSHFPINGAHWSPLHPDIIFVLISDTVLVFDIRKEMVKPVSSVCSKFHEKLVSMCFTNDGRKLLTGDVSGNILLFALSGMQFIPNNPNLAIANTIVKRLKERLKQESKLQALSQLGPPFSNLI
jgi:WD40 repeat protein